METRRACLLACLLARLKGRGVYEYIHISSNLHPSPQFYVAMQHGSKVRAKCTLDCIQVANWFKRGNSRIEIATIILFEHPPWSRIILSQKCL